MEVIMADVQKLFDKLYDCIIEKMQYDCFDARFNLEVLDLETGERYVVLFDDVTSCLFTMSGFEGKICKDVCPELSSILLKKVYLNTDDSCVSSYPLNYNICIEVMDRIILLKTNSVIINSDFYELV